jgi:hypothetical protein
MRAKWHSVLMAFATLLAVVGCAPAPPTQQHAEGTVRLPGEAVPSTDAGHVSDPAEARERALEKGALARVAQSRARESELRAQESARYVQDGYGLFVGVGGERYRGEIRAGKRNGYGVDMFPSGDRYEGQEFENQKSGLGVYMSSKGDRYEGEFATDHSNGWGVYTWPDGRRYEGRFADDHPNGPGILTDIAGTTHAGVWKEGTLIDFFAPSRTAAAASSPLGGAVISAKAQSNVVLERHVRCLMTAAAALDDRVSPADVIAVAAINQCRPVAILICRQNIECSDEDLFVKLHSEKIFPMTVTMVLNHRAGRS